ncbi:MAG: hypothetical protein GY874_08690 [Desulfobacteraceae bacterium]|nr:hypothetical protein [Desulfobacteraceae bacterium]
MKFFTKLAVVSSLLLFIVTNAVMGIEVENDIDAVIKQYFDLKYESLHTLDVKDFSHLLDNNVRAQEFFKDETDKIEIEIANAEKNSLRYLEYKYFIEYESINISQNPEIATVALIEGHDVVFEVHPDEVSKMRGLKHTILLRNTDKGWKIITDIYEDELKMFLNKAKLNKKQAIEQIQMKSLAGETDTDSVLLEGVKKNGRD